MKLFPVGWLAIACVVGGRSDKSTDKMTADSSGSARLAPGSAVFTRGGGGSVQTSLGYGIRVNANSSLQRESITAHDSLLPADLAGTIGVKTVYEPRRGYSSGDYKYRASVPVSFRDSLAAIEIRFVLFDIWGEFVKTLSMTEIEEMPAGSTKVFTPSWSLYSENEASEDYASIAYIARARARSGRVFEAAFEPIVLEAREFSERFSAEDLDPTRRPPRDTTTTR